MQEIPPHKRFLVGYGSPLMRLTQHPAPLRAWCKQAMPAWSVKTRPAPPRHCKDARVDGLTTAMDDMNTPAFPLKNTKLVPALHRKSKTRTPGLRRLLKVDSAVAVQIAISHGYDDSSTQSCEYRPRANKPKHCCDRHQIRRSAKLKLRERLFPAGLS